MAGIGTTMLACSLGRDVVLVELEEKFCKLAEANRDKMHQDGWMIGDCQIIQGDARDLKILLDGNGNEKLANTNSICNSVGHNCSYPKQLDKIISSPPYEQALNRWAGDKRTKLMEDKGLHAMPKGDEGLLVDKIVTSPPYAIPKTTKGSLNAQEGKVYQDTRQGRKGTGWEFSGQEELGHPTPDNIANLPYGNIDSIITSPPYEATVSSGEGTGATTKYRKDARASSLANYSEAQDNIGNLKSQSYLEAMLQVYQSCFAVLKPQGLMILVTKNFIRKKQVIRLDLDTIGLCEQAGFKLIERHYRKLTQQSFWRVIYHKKYPDVEKIEHEDILVFQKGEGGGQVDKIITSQPFAGNTGGLKSAKGFKYGADKLGERMMGGIKGGTGSHPDNIDRLPYRSIFREV